MDNIKHIKDLLEKFYEGQSSLEEELELKSFFSKETVPKEFDADKKLFRSLDSIEQDVDVPVDLNKNIIEKLHQAEKSEVRVRRISIYSLSGLAAGLLIILSVYLGLMKENQNTSFLAEYTVEDPELAYKEARNALALVSEKWNAGTRELNSLEQVNRGLETISTINKISSGSKEINLLGNLKKANNIDIQ